MAADLGSLLHLSVAGQFLSIGWVAMRWMIRRGWRWSHAVDIRNVPVSRRRVEFGMAKRRRDFPDKALCCRVCGYEMDDPPWGSDGRTPTFEMCPCCGVEFGYQDHTPSSAKLYRGRWVESGCRWDLQRERPSNWDAAKQLQQVPDGFV